MEILFTGKGGNSGSWEIRGNQLGRMGTVAPNCQNPRGFDVAVVVKRTPDTVIQTLRASGIPWVWDIVDAYPQPHANLWTKREGIEWVRKQVANLRPAGIIWPNRKMMEDCEIDLPQNVLYHHHRPNLKLNPIRDTVRTVGYEGGNYLGTWRPIIEAECRKRGWDFVVNPGELANLDIVVAFREPTGYVPFSWKSNVKLANAHGSGTPFVGAPENGYIDTQSGAEYWACNKDDLRVSFDWLEDQSSREQVRDRFLSAAYPLEQAQADLKDFLCRFK